MEKQKTGFKFGKNPTKLIKIIDQTGCNGRTYRLCLVEADGKQYHSLRLYNNKGKFIKQFMTEPKVAPDIAGMYAIAATN